MRKATLFAKLQFPVFFGLLIGRILLPDSVFPIFSVIFHILAPFAIFCLIRGVWSICKYNSWEQKQEKTLKNIPNKENEIIKHLVIMTMYKEDIQVAYETLNHLKNCHNKFNLTICLATEARDNTAPAKVDELQNSFKDCFTDIISTCHPDDPLEIKGKGSNVNFAFQTIRTMSKKWDLIHILDIDTLHQEDYFKRIESIWLLSNKSERSKLFFACPIAFNRNDNEVAWVTKLVDRFWSLGNLTCMYPNTNLLMPISTYSLSFKLAEKMNGWDSDAFGIGEDLHCAVKAYCKTNGDVDFQAIYAPASALHVTRERVGKDSCWGDLEARYDQACRHLWGVLTWSYLLEYICENPKMLRKWSCWLVISRVFEPICSFYFYFTSWAYCTDFRVMLRGTWLNGLWMCTCYLLITKCINSKWGMDQSLGKTVLDMLLLVIFGPILIIVYTILPIMNAIIKHVFSLEYRGWITTNHVKPR